MILFRLEKIPFSSGRRFSEMWTYRCPDCHNDIIFNYDAPFSCPFCVNTLADPTRLLREHVTKISWHKCNAAGLINRMDTAKRETPHYE